MKEIRLSNFSTFANNTGEGEERGTEVAFVLPPLLALGSNLGPPKNKPIEH